MNNAAVQLCVDGKLLIAVGVEVRAQTCIAPLFLFPAVYVECFVHADAGKNERKAFWHTSLCRRRSFLYTNGCGMITIHFKASHLPSHG